MFQSARCVFLTKGRTISSPFCLLPSDRSWPWTSGIESDLRLVYLSHYGEASPSIHCVRTVLTFINLLKLQLRVARKMLATIVESLVLLTLGSPLSPSLSPLSFPLSVQSAKQGISSHEIHGCISHTELAKKNVLSCVISPLRQQAESRNLGHTFLANSVFRSVIWGISLEVVSVGSWGICIQLLIYHSSKRTPLCSFGVVSRAVAAAVPRRPLHRLPSQFFARGGAALHRRGESGIQTRRELGEWEQGLSPNVENSHESTSILWIGLL